MFDSFRQVREQSLNHRGPEIPETAVAPAASKSTWGQSLKKHGKAFLWGTAATMAFSYLFEKLNSKGSSTAVTDTADAAGSPAYSTTPAPTNSPYSPSTNSPSTSPDYSSSTPPYSPSTSPDYSSSNPPYSSSTIPSYSSSTNPADPTPTQNGYQQRDVVKSILGQPLVEPWFADDINDSLAILSRSSKARSTSDEDDNRQGTYYKNDRDYSPAVTGRPFPWTFWVAPTW